MARDSFATFIPISVESDARTKIIFDFFDLLSAVAAHAKSNGFGGRKLSRLAAWWAFEHTDGGNGFDGGYKMWSAYVQGIKVWRSIANENLVRRTQQAIYSSRIFDHFLRTPSKD